MEGFIVDVVLSSISTLSVDLSMELSISILAFVSVLFDSSSHDLKLKLKFEK